MTPSSSSRKGIVGRSVSKADKTLELEADLRGVRLRCPLGPDIGSARALVSALQERTAVTETLRRIMFEISICKTPPNCSRSPRLNRETRQITCPSPTAYFPTGYFLGTRQGKGCRADDARRILVLSSWETLSPSPSSLFPFQMTGKRSLLRENPSRVRSLTRLLVPYLIPNCAPQLL
jgi:hypothetical protein